MVLTFNKDLVVSRILETHWSIPELCSSLLLQMLGTFIIWLDGYICTYVNMCIYIYIHIHTFAFIYIILYTCIWEYRERKHLQSHPKFTVHISYAPRKPHVFVGAITSLRPSMGWDFSTAYVASRPSKIGHKIRNCKTQRTRNPSISPWYSHIQLDIPILAWYPSGKVTWLWNISIF